MIIYRNFYSNIQNTGQPSQQTRTHREQSATTYNFGPPSFTQSTDRQPRTLSVRVISCCSSPPTLTLHVLKVYWVSEKLPDIWLRCSCTDSKKQTENHHPRPLPWQIILRNTVWRVCDPMELHEEAVTGWNVTLNLGFSCVSETHDVETSMAQCSDAVPLHEWLHLSLPHMLWPDSCENWLGFTWLSSSVRAAAGIQLAIPRQVRCEPSKCKNASGCTAVASHTLSSGCLGDAGRRSRLRVTICTERFQPG